MNETALLGTVEKGLATAQEREYFLIHQARYAYILHQTLNIASHPRRKLKILDVGCYPYHLGRTLELAGHDVYGISSAHEPIHSPKINVCNIETDTFPFPVNAFDLVICTEVLEHLPQAPAHALKQMLRVTKKGGHLLVTTPNIARSINRAKLLLGKSVSYPLAQLLEDEGRGSIIYHRHNREYTLDELTHLIQFSGWNIAHAAHFVSYTPTRKRARPDGTLLKLGKWGNYLLMQLVPSLRDTLFVLGEKS